MTNDKKQKDKKQAKKPSYGQSNTMSRRDQLLTRIAEVLAKKA